MPTRPSPILPTLLLLATLAQCHKPGQEYTYLSMFIKPQTPDMIEGDNHLGQVYEQLSVHSKLNRQQLARLTRPANLKLYQPQPKPPDTTSEGNENRADQRLSRTPLSGGTNLAVKALDREEDEDEDYEEEDEEDTNLRRKPMPDSVGNVHLLGDEDSKEHTTDNDLADQMAHKYGENLERIQTMLLKIIRMYDIQSMADVPCRAHAHWMPLFLEKVSEEKERFKYYCVDTSKEVLKSVKESVSKPRSSKFILRRFWQEGLPNADLVFSWAGLDNMQPENVVKYLGRLAKTGESHKMIAIGTHGGGLKKKGTKNLIARFTAGGTPINVREAPFKLRKPMRIIGDLSTQGNDKKLYLYKADDMM